MTTPSCHQGHVIPYILYMHLAAEVQYSAKFQEPWASIDILGTILQAAEHPHKTLACTLQSYAMIICIGQLIQIKLGRSQAVGGMPVQVALHAVRKERAEQQMKNDKYPAIPFRGKTATAVVV
jgi:hypothetical protein